MTLADPPRRRPQRGSSALLWLGIGGGVLVLLVIVLVVALSGGGVPDEWVKYRSSNGGWEAAFPREPRPISVGLKENGAEMIGVELNEWSRVAVMYSPISGEEWKWNEEETLEQFLSQDEGMGEPFESKKRLKIDGHPACEVVVRTPGGRVKNRLVVANHSLYLASASIVPGFCSEREADIFLNSFHIVAPPLPAVEPPNGKVPPEGDLLPKQ